MNKNIGIVVGVLVIVLIGAAVYASTNKKDDAMMLKDESVVVEDTMVKDEEVMDKEGEKVMDDKADTMMKAGSYVAYSGEKIAMAETGDVVLFFHASWCPSCRGLDADIQKNLNAIPESVTILKTDYDTQTELKKKYGVTSQHTLVQVDKDGNMIKKWSGSSNLGGLLGQIN